MSRKIILNEQELNLIKEMYENNFSKIKIMEKIKICEEVLNRILLELNLPPNKHAKKPIEITVREPHNEFTRKLINLFYENVPVFKICEELDISHATFMRAVKKNNLDTSHRTVLREVSKEVCLLVKNLYDQKLTKNQISDKLNLPISTVKTAYKKLNINVALDNNYIKEPLNIKFYSQESLELVSKLFYDGYGVKKIMKATGLTICRIRNIQKVLNLPRHERDCKKIMRDKSKYECKICKFIKPINNFQRIKKGKIVYRSTCLACFKLHKAVSNSIRKSLATHKMLKTNKSFEALGYTLFNLKNHLESQFEFWMNWDNHGPYIPAKWKDDDISTWKWNLDHIIPHSTFKYTSMNDESFKACWALSNLRPLSAKQNIIDGVTRKRHK